MKITDLIINTKSLGNKLWLVEVVPAYEYKEGKRTDAISAYRYTVAMPEHNLEKIAVKIEGKPLLESPKGFVEVTFTDLEIFIY